MDSVPSVRATCCTHPDLRSSPEGHGVELSCLNSGSIGSQQIRSVFNTIRHVITWNRLESFLIPEYFMLDLLKVKMKELHDIKHHLDTETS